MSHVTHAEPGAKGAIRANTMASAIRARRTIEPKITRCARARVTFTRPALFDGASCVTAVTRDRVAIVARFTHGQRAITAPRRVVIATAHRQRTREDHD